MYYKHELHCFWAYNLDCGHDAMSNVCTTNFDYIVLGPTMCTGAIMYNVCMMLCLMCVLQKWNTLFLGLQSRLWA